MTLEDRAHNYGLKKCGGLIIKGTKGMIYKGSHDRYIEIAKEQHDIDVDNAWEYFVNNKGNIDKDSFYKFMKTNY